jgi:hypothetical protein
VKIMFALEAGIFIAHTAIIKLAQNYPTNWWWMVPPVLIVLMLDYLIWQPKRWDNPLTMQRKANPKGGRPAGVSSCQLAQQQMRKRSSETGAHQPRRDAQHQGESTSSDPKWLPRSNKGSQLEC